MSEDKRFLNKKLALSLGGISLLMPLVLNAQPFRESKELLTNFQGLLNTVIIIATRFAFLFFVWGIAQFVRNAYDPAGREQGRQQMLWGIVALFVLVSIWGIVLWIQGELEISSAGPSEVLKLFGP